jgi:hypothetical protein
MEADMTTNIEIVTVGALKQFLKDIPDDYEVILSKDGEGNVFSPLSGGISFGNYIDETAFIGDFEFNDDKPTAIVLFPLS